MCVSHIHIYFDLFNLLGKAYFEVNFKREVNCDEKRHISSTGE